MKEYGYNTGLGAVLSTAPFSATGMGGQMTHSYNYDGLYRLVNATGNYTGASGKAASYSLDMQYDNLHNIVSKKQHVQQSNIVFDGTLKAGYDLAYNYDKPFQISTLQDENYRTEGDVEKDKITNEHAYKYDANGNLIYVNTSREKQDGTKEDGSGEKKYLWDEENRLLAANTNGFISSYWYDASGERVIKASGDDEGVYVNGLFSGARTETSNFTAYINPYLVVSKGGNYTKHIYIGSQRIVSKLGDLDSYGQDPRRIPYAGSDVEGASVDYAGKYKESQQTIKDRYGDFEVSYYGKDNDDYVNGGGFCCDDNPSLRAGAIGNGNDNPEIYQYYYHSDHLGSTSLITDLDGDIVQHVEYVPFGEVFIEERNNRWNTPYLFNAKELDEETGLYYYGKRYYDSRISLFLGTDPLQEKYPNVSTYAYCGNNPVRFIDLHGDSITMSDMQQYDQTINTNNTQQTIDDLQAQTGLKISLTADGKMSYAKNKKGDPIIATTKDAKGKTVQVGSATARNFMIAAINHQDMVTVSPGTRSGVLPGTNTMGLNAKQIESFINGTEGMDNRTLGWGMILMHELHHTQVGGGLKDTPGNPGPVVTQMNIIRSELNSQGGNYGERLDYLATPVGNNVYIPFSRPSKEYILMNLPPKLTVRPGQQFIKF